MEAVVGRKQTSFRLREDLLRKMKLEARKENRSLNNFVENKLMELETLDLDNFKDYVKSL